jgi:hypothetical protein
MKIMKFKDFVKEGCCGGAMASANSVKQLDKVEAGTRQDIGTYGDVNLLKKDIQSKRKHRRKKSR